MDRKTFDITKKLNRMKEEMDLLKTSQPLAGDGWRVYRRKATFSLVNGNDYRIDYVTDDEHIDVSTTIVFYGGRQIFESFDNDGSWFFTHTSASGDFEIQVYSVRIGTITLTSV